MNGRNLRHASLAAALAAAAFVVSSNAAAQEAAPATEPTAAPSEEAAPTEPAAAEPTAGDPADGDETKKAQQPPVEGTPPAETPGVSVSLGGDAQPRKDEIVVDSKKSSDEEESRNRFAGSVFFWDHSVSTQTAGVEWDPQQSYSPSYQWWFSFQPRYHFTKKLSYRGRADLFKEMTNVQDTTYYRENEFGDVWNTLRYETPISERLKHTKVSVSGLLKLPLSKASQAQGVYFKPSLGVGVSQKIPINGESAKWFPGANVALSGSYEKPIIHATTATGGGFERVRQDSEGRSFVTDQISGSMLNQHTVLGSLRGDIGITEKWGASLSLIMINNWLHAPTGDVSVRTATGMVDVPRDGDATRFNQLSWLILATDYDVIDEMSVGIGYYNLAGIIGSNGERRGLVGSDNIWWSPSARIFATVTANLDKIYERAAGIKKPEPEKTAKKPAGAASY